MVNVVRTSVCGYAAYYRCYSVCAAKHYKYIYIRVEKLYD